MVENIAKEKIKRVGSVKSVMLAKLDKQRGTHHTNNTFRLFSAGSY